MVIVMEVRVNAFMKKKKWKMMMNWGKKFHFRGKIIGRRMGFLALAINMVVESRSFALFFLQFKHSPCS